MTADEIRAKYLKFFQHAPRNHVVIPSAPLVPENDPTTLLNSAGMQPLIQYLLGAPHPLGKRITNSQKSFRSQDIEEVGDNRHETFFEMLGNWSLGDYFKKEQLPWIWEFLTEELHLPKEKLYVSVFKGNNVVPRDEESASIWKSLGIPTRHIFYYEDNWWSISGMPEKMAVGEPGGPDSEVFYDFGPSAGSGQVHQCHPNCNCGRFMEIGNSVFMQYIKTEDGGLKELPQRNVDFGGGLERLNASVNGTPDIFQTDSFSSIIKIVADATKKQYGADGEETRAMRIIADHMRGAIMMIADGVFPSNKQQGYILRRLIRRSMLYAKKLGVWGDWGFIKSLVAPVAAQYKSVYPSVSEQKEKIKNILIDEAGRFGKTVEKGLKEIEKMDTVDGKQAFLLYETYGFPWELTEEIAIGKGQRINRAEFEEAFKKHQTLSRTASVGMFKGGLADHSVETTKLHTATHLLHTALRKVLGTHIGQRGSNITVDRLRFDFSHPEKITPEQLKKIEEMVNSAIHENLQVTMEEMNKEKALASGAIGFFIEKYGDRVKVYTVGDKNGTYFSREICGGPHVSFTGEVGHFTIDKEESAGSGIRRIYGHLEHHENHGTNSTPISP
ncbi:MAG: alanine--tRNA ligase [Candidatus Gottesmanbacteria bacterium]